jgi:NAD(P)-dependent dehydrogenase (short-subunit alcohol dehydrogenase family)
LNSHWHLIWDGTRSVARGLKLKTGQSVIATSRKPEVIQAELNGIYDAETLNRALVVGLDVSKVEEVKAVLAKAIDKFGRIDIIINNAGYVSRVVNLC